VRLPEARLVSAGPSAITAGRPAYCRDLTGGVDSTPYAAEQLRGMQSRPGTAEPALGLAMPPQVLRRAMVGHWQPLVIERQYTIIA
jgi:hypothetical protein